MPVLLADIGGTHIRFALRGAEGPQNIKKYRLDNFPDRSETV